MEGRKIKASCMYLHANPILPNTQCATWTPEGVGWRLTDPQVQLLPHVHGVAHSLIRLGQVFTGRPDGSGRDLRETGSQHRQTGLHWGRVTKGKVKSLCRPSIKGSFFLNHLERNVNHPETLGGTQFSDEVKLTAR